MYFDQLCTIAERHIESVRPLLEQARIFLFPGRPQDILPKAYTDEENAVMRDYFFLPVRIVAVEDAASCVILGDTEKEQRGINGKRFFVDCVAQDTSSDLFDDPQDALDRWSKDQGSFPGSATISVGYVDQVVPQGPTKLFVHGTVKWIMLADKRKVHAVFPATEEVIRGVLRNVKAALEEVFYFNNPARCVLETRPAAVKPPKKRKKKRKLLRSHNRPIYTLLTPKEIREKLMLPQPNGQHAKKRPHDRRRHYRTYSDDPKQWPKVHGKVIVVPATWVGPSESVRDGKRYKVRLDL